MTITYIAWRNCRLQANFGSAGFLDLWLLTLDRLDTATSDSASATWLGQPNNSRREIQYHLRSGEMLIQSELDERLDDFNQGSDECASCSVNFTHKPRGCCGALDTPLDEKFESALAEYFSHELKVSDSAASKFYRESIEPQANSRNPFDLARGRGLQVDLAARAEPVTIKFGSFFHKRLLTSSAILSCVFSTQERGPQQALYRLFLQHCAGDLRVTYRTILQASKSGKQFAEYAKHFGIASKASKMQRWLVDVLGE